jgi:uncharacterized sulfatase
MYEESLRTPLLMRWPGHIPAGTTAAEMVMNIDFAPTFLQLAGLDIPAHVQGDSMARIMRGETPRDWRDSIYYHYYEYPGFHMVKAHYGVRTHRYKLIHFYDDIDEWEFFDLEVDPHELNNLIDDPDKKNEIAALRAELHKLREQFQDHDDGQ